MKKINSGRKYKVCNATFIEKNRQLAEAEVFLTACVINPDMANKRLAFFSPKAQPEFYYITKSYGYNQESPTSVPICPEDVIGLGDGEVTINPVPNKAIKPPCCDMNKICYVNNPLAYCPGYGARVTCHEIVQALPRTDDGVLYPLLALLAIKLTALHNKIYTPEMAAEELFDMEMIKRPEYMAPLSINGPIVPTFPRNPTYSSTKYSLGYTWTIPGGQGNIAQQVLTSNEKGHLLPLSFWAYEGRPFPLTFPAFHTAHTPLLNKYQIKDKSPIFMTEYIELAYDNSQNEHHVVVAFFGGEKGIKHNDFSPLYSKKVIYLLLAADGETNTDRAYHVALKVFAELYRGGNRSFEVLDCETEATIHMEKVKRDAIVHGILEADLADLQEALANGLTWAKCNPGETIVGRAFQSGRIGLIHARGGIGKSLMAQAISTVAVTKKSMDHGLFEFKGTRQCRVLFIQTEMSEADIAIRQKSLDDYMGNNKPTKIEFHACEKPLTCIDEQAAVLQRLMALDPKGECQWLVWIDTIKSTMPEVLDGNGNVFSEKVLPWIKLMADAGICVTLIHHDNAQEKCFGPGTLKDLVDFVWHITSDAQPQSSRNEVVVELTKKRHLTGKQAASARWSWEIDENKRLNKFESEFLDGEDSPQTDASADEVNDTTSSEVKPKETEHDILDSLPHTIDELRALDVEQRKTAFFELWNSLKTKKAIADHLGVSDSLIEKAMSEIGVDTNSKGEYFRNKHTKVAPYGQDEASPSNEEA